ncbi:MAG: endolytic transglycosylase MltG, partial [Maritimibacter sp.]
RAGDKVADVLERMRAEQQGRLDAAWANRAGDLPYDTPEEALIMASIVEKETGIATERKQVASVFVNRLRRGMRLQTDPSVIYGLTHGEGSLGRGLRQSELRGDTPYNTYVNAGLPPTPIANPGLDAIEAAMNPATTEYLYFVAKTLNPADGHVFAATLNEHNRNVAKLRALEAQQ